MKLIVILMLLAVTSGLTYKFTNSLDNEQNKNARLTTEVTLLREELDNMRQINLKLLEEVELRNDVTSVIVDASRHYNLDPKLLALVVKSEGNFRPNPNHKLPYVVGAGGINVKAHPKTLHNPQSYVGNFYATAEIIEKYLRNSDSLTLALTKYKGFSNVGYLQAKEIVKEYNKQ